MDVDAATVAVPHGDSRADAVVAVDVGAEGEVQRQWRICRFPRRNTSDVLGSVPIRRRVRMRRAAAVVAAAAADAGAARHWP